MAAVGASQTAHRPAAAAATERAAQGWLWATVTLTAGAFIAAIALAPPAGAAPERGLEWLLFLGSSVHVASTGWLFTQRDVRAYAARRPARPIWVPAAVVAASALAAAALPPSAVRWLLLPFFAWQFFHFQKQNLGLAALAASASGLPSLKPAERRALMAAGGAAIGRLMAHPELLQVSVGTGPRVLLPLSAIAFGLAALAGLALLARRPAADRNAGLVAVYLMALVFWLPIFWFASPYAAVGGMTIAHGLQYLLLVGLVAAGPRSADGAGRRSGRLLRLAVLCNIALLGGAVLAAASHRHGTPAAGRLLFGGYLGALMAHFVVDAGLWRLRDRFPRAFLAGRIPYLVPAGGQPVPGRSQQHRSTMDRSPI